jgi:hypothetical protein
VLCGCNGCNVPHSWVVWVRLVYRTAWCSLRHPRIQTVRQPNMGAFFLQFVLLFVNYRVSNDCCSLPGYVLALCVHWQGPGFWDGRLVKHDKAQAKRLKQQEEEEKRRQEEEERGKTAASHRRGRRSRAGSSLAGSSSALNSQPSFTSVQSLSRTNSKAQIVPHDTDAV